MTKDTIPQHVHDELRKHCTKYTLTLKSGKVVEYEWMFGTWYETLEVRPRKYASTAWETTHAI